MLARPWCVRVQHVLREGNKCADILSRLPADRFVTELNARIYAALTSKIVNGEDYSFSSFSEEFSPQEVDRITQIVTENSGNGIDAEVAEDCIRVLLDYKNSSSDDESELTDDDLLKMVEKLRSGQ